ncbi:MAG: hypothetical protein KJO98_06015, partial [Rhodothermia bacterium]|nr:hypothetical protein [Rhodothermia bacterium]
MLIRSRGKSRYGLLCVLVIPVVLLARPGGPEIGGLSAGADKTAPWHPDYAAERDGVRQHAVQYLRSPAPRDTLQFDAAAGQVFITVLPDSVSSGSIIEMSNVRVPANSWRTGHAFFWQIGPNDTGVY